MYPIAKLIVGERFFKRFVFHSGTKDQVLSHLEDSYGFDRAELPEPIGGELEIDCQRWIQERFEIEERAFSIRDTRCMG